MISEGMLFRHANGIVSRDDLDRQGKSCFGCILVNISKITLMKYTRPMFRM
jgi:hypothetical protein